jgi:glycosyltransferase involved in cell wall biosynthesis
MRILHIATRHRVGGAERNLMGLIAREVALGHDVEVALGEERTDVGFGEVPVRAVAQLQREISPLADVRAVKRIRDLILRGGYDVVHTHQSKAGVVGRIAAARSGAYVIHSVHMPSFGDGYRRAESRAFVAAERLCARATQEYVFVGREIRDMYVARGVADESRATLLRSPVPISRLLASRDDGRQKDALRKRLIRGPIDAVVVAIVSALDARKRVDLAIRMLAPILRAGRVYLVIAGEGPEDGAIRELIRAEGLVDSVQMLGHVAEVDDVFIAADVLVHTSRVEGVPQVVIQALAGGLPVVATEAEGLREVGDAAIRVLDRTGVGLAEAVLAVAANPPKAVAPEALRDWDPRVVQHEVDRWIRRVENRATSSSPLRIREAAYTR